MAKIDTLIEQITDPTLRATIAREVSDLANRRTFGLVFERHLPETIRLPSVPIRRGSTVMLRDRKDTKVWQVTRISVAIAHLRDDDGNTAEIPVPDLVTARVFGQPIYPGLKATKTITRGGDKPHHLVINGENHHALQALKYTHTQAIDVIYIDPPYNTGGDFAYSDKYVESTDAYRHSKWLSFMEKRLRIARDLLKQTGVIIVAIDDNEHANLKLLMNQIFGSDNFIANVVWNGSRKNDARFISVATDYMLFYGRNVDLLTKQGVRWHEPKAWADEVLEAAAEIWSASMQRPEEATRRLKAWYAKQPKGRFSASQKHYSLIDEEGRVFSEQDPGAPGRDGPRYDILHPVTGQPCRIPANGWRYTEETFNALINAGRVHFREDHTSLPRPKTFLHEQLNEKAESVFYSSRKSPSHYLAKVLGSKRFAYPKDHTVLMRWLRMATGKNGVFLDFFAGSGSTAEAVMELNAEDNAVVPGSGQRQCIIITNNEVSSATARKLEKEGIYPGDEAWEEQGIYRQVTEPRVETVVSGRRPDRTKFSDGLDENVTFCELTYLDRADIERGRAFGQIAHLLWAQAGARGSVIGAVTDSWAAPADARYAVLFDVDQWNGFVRAVKDHDSLTHAFVVTDSDSAFNHVERALPDHLHVVRLYEDYLSTFEINTREH